jgi:superfamily II DNA/RNA helicase
MSNTTETNASNPADHAAAPYTTEHYFVEVGGDILSKPSSLSDLLEQQGFPTAVVFCNTPSDTDLLEVLLRKRGIAATKLIGYVPPQKLERTLDRLKTKELTTVVVTDIAARNLNLGDFDLVVNYSIQNDGEVYLQRAGLSLGSATETAGGGDARPARTPARKVISLLNPLDIANFHFMKKAANVEFTKLEPPSKADILAARVNNLSRKATSSPLGNDENYRAMAQQVLSHPQKDSMLAFLLHSALEIVPQLSSDLEKAIAERDALSLDDGVQPGAFPQGQRWREDDDQGSSGRRGGRGGRDRGGRRGGDDFERNRGPRRDSRRFDDERPEGDDEQFARQPRGEEGFDDYGDEGGQGRGRGSRGGYGSREHNGGRGQGGRRGGREDRREPRAPRHVTRIKDDRLYIGLGARDGFNEQQFVDLIQGEGVERDLLKKFSLRENYAFADLPEEQSNKVLEALKDRDFGGKKMFITKAVTLTTTVELPQEEGGSEFTEESGDFTEEAPHAVSEEGGEGQPQTLEDSYQ